MFPCEEKTNFSTHTITLSKISIQLKEYIEISYKDSPKFRRFFVLVASSGEYLDISEFKTEKGRAIQFSKEWSFDGAPAEFQINIKLFCLKLRCKDKSIKKQKACTTFPLFYEDPLIREYVEKRVIDTSFQLCAETTLNINNINQRSHRLTSKPDIYSNLNDNIKFHLTIK
ncbi:hypothetical protein GWI33_011058 [Rhynchophorus ferrugineus]|uniref:Anillin homology domain-containing protein n=1 Tax=Rhynchophorus ferrugineus TaxID=354439 RepID=A0A834IDA1_RHYFE|nr:hypothetical protein GWI33_011058 [Rhynchophorus ferrugineus]